MSFRRTSNQTDQWLAYCQNHSQYVDQLPRLSPLFNSSQRFDEFLQTGVFDKLDGMITIQSLTDAEWAPFELFVDHYSSERETYFDPLTYRGYHHERNRRNWRPTTDKFTTSDLSSQWLAILFWAPWNAHCRTMDSNLISALSCFPNVVFRAINVDNAEFRNVCTNAEVLNVPALALYHNAERSETIVGVRPPTEIEQLIRTWVDPANDR